MGVFSDIKNLGRVSRVISVLASNSMGYYIHEFGLKSHLPFHKQILLNIEEKDSIPSRLRKSMEELGGLYVKLGQFLSLRPDLAPEEYRNEFSKLQDRVKPLEFETIKSVIEKELGKSTDELFLDIADVPTGSASIAQVHLATLKTGETVILKVKRPGIEKIFQQDISVLYYLAKKIEKKQKYKNFSPTIFVEEFERYTTRELNFQIEAGYIDKFYNLFKDSKEIKIPKVYRELCTNNLIVMEYIKGKKLREFSLKELTKRKKDIARSLVDACLKQVFELGTFHADLHPGNILLTQNGKIAFIDFGIIGNLTEDMKNKGIKLYISLILGDPDEVADALMDAGKKTSDFDIYKFKEDVNDIVASWHNTQLKTYRITTMLHRLLDTSIQNGLRIPPDTILLAKALVTVEGTCLQLDPNFNFVKFSEPYIEKLAKSKIKSQSTLKTFMLKTKKLKDIAYNLPAESYELVKKLNKGEVMIDIDDVEIKNLAANLNTSSTMLSSSVIIAAVIVAFALILSGKIQLSNTIMIIIFISIIILAILAFIIIKRRQ